MGAIDLEKLRFYKNEYHLALQNVAAVGRTFLPEDPHDKNAWLVWIPGLWRMAGKWVEGIHKFRSSVSFEDFNIYLVDEKVQTLDAFNLEEKTLNQAFVWLEQHIISLNLSSSHLVMNLPYQLPQEVMDKKQFSLTDSRVTRILGGYFHDAFIIHSEYKEKFEHTRDIFISPKRMHMEMDVVIIETDEEETDTLITLGFSPGDQIYNEPYFYVTSRPYLDEENLPKFSTRGFWHQDEWIGAVYLAKNLWDSSNQKETAMYFFDEAIEKTRSLLLN